METKIVLLFFLFVTLVISSLAQELSEPKFSLNSYYGLAYSSSAIERSDYPIDLSVPAIGSFYGFDLDFKIPDERYWGISFSRQIHAKTIDQIYTIPNANIGVVLRNFRITHETFFFDVHLRRRIVEHLNFTVGFYYFLEYEHTFDLDEIAGELYYVMDDINTARADDFGPLVAIDYMWPINEYLEFGMQGRVYFNLAGLQSAALHPTVRVKF